MCVRVGCFLCVCVRVCVCVRAAFCVSVCVCVSVRAKKGPFTHQSLLVMGAQPELELVLKIASYDPVEVCGH